MSEISTKQGRVWSITINNPTEDDLQAWESLKTAHWVEEVLGQMEQGAQGTQHLQGMLKTKKVRFSQVKRALPRAHIEAGRNENALRLYVQKDDTRVGAIPAPRARVATQQDLQDRLYWLTLRDLYGDDYILLGSNTEDLKKRMRTACVTYFLETRCKNQHAFAERQIMNATQELIEQGYYGIEYITANPVIRNGIKENFESIIIREHANRTSEASTT